MLFGCVTGGPLSDHTNQHLSEGISVFFMALSLAFAPWCKNFVGFSVSFVVQGIFTGLHSVGE